MHGSLDKNRYKSADRYWAVVNTPVFAADGSVKYIMNQPSDVTQLVQLRDRNFSSLLGVDVIGKPLIDAIPKVEQQGIVALLDEDEFLLILENTDREQAETLAQRISQAIADIAFYWAGNRYSITASIGISRFGTSVGKRFNDGLSRLVDTDGTVVPPGAFIMGRAMAYIGQRRFKPNISQH